MNKRTFKLAGVLLITILLSIIATAILSPALARSNNKKESLTIFRGSGGTFNLQLPDGIPSHPTNLQFVFFDFDKRSTVGAFDAMIIALWVPTLNGYLPVGVVSDSPNPEFFEHAHTVLENTAFWLPMLGFSNIIQVSETELEVDKRGNILTAELTVPIELSLSFPDYPSPPFNLLDDLSFTLPPIKAEIRGFNSIFREESSQTLVPHPPLSGYTITQNTLNKPAWVRFWSASWLGIQPQCTTGTLYVHVTRTYTPPT